MELNAVKISFHQSNAKYVPPVLPVLLRNYPGAIASDAEKLHLLKSWGLQGAVISFYGAIHPEYYQFTPINLVVF